MPATYLKEEKPLNPHLPIWMQATMPRITQDGRDGDEEIGYIAEISDGTTIGFKYFRFENVQKITIRTRGYIRASLKSKLLGTAMCSVRLTALDLQTFGKPIRTS